MKNHLFIFFAFTFLALVSCQPRSQQSTEEYQNEVKQKIAELDKLYFEAWENEELDSTLTFLDEGFINMFGFGMNQSKEVCRKDWKRVFDMYIIEGVEFNPVELLVDQNYAIETGLFKQRWITNDKMDTISFNMRGMTVYKKQKDGNWKMFRLMGQQ